jgi:opacity protein-like surface antigen
MKKILATMALLTVIATPAFAQSFNAQEGTGNELPFSYKSTAHDTQSIARANGENAFAMAPGEKTTNDPYSPANTGGGSEGYNWDLAHNY